MDSNGTSTICFRFPNDVFFHMIQFLHLKDIMSLDMVLNDGSLLYGF